MGMDNKYQIPKNKKPEGKTELLEQQIQELIKRRDKESNPAAKQELHREIMKLFAQYERSKL
jgi:hypothetical protein